MLNVNEKLKKTKNRSNHFKPHQKPQTVDDGIRVGVSEVLRTPQRGEILTPSPK